MRMFFIIATLSALLLCSCGSYTLRGKVIEGLDSDVTVVSADDPRLNEPGIRQVRINVHRDPGGLAQELAGSGLSDADGTFAIELPGFGAGWMDETWLVETAQRTLRLPSNTNRHQLLIIVAPGTATPSEHRDDLWEDYRRYR